MTATGGIFVMWVAWDVKPPTASDAFKSQTASDFGIC